MCLLAHRLAMLCLSVCCCVVVIQASQDAKPPKRIDLKPGGPALIVEGEVKKGNEVEYVFKANAGQKFSARFIKKMGNTGFAVNDPDGQGLPEEEHDFNTVLRGSLEKTGDYKIIVSSFETSVCKYSLSVRITEK